MISNRFAPVLVGLSTALLALVQPALAPAATDPTIAQTAPTAGAVVAHRFVDSPGQGIDYYGADVAFLANVPGAAGPVTLLVSETATTDADGLLDGGLCQGRMTATGGDGFGLRCSLYAQGDTEFWQVATGSGTGLRASPVRQVTVRGGRTIAQRTVAYALDDTWDHATDLAVPSTFLENGDLGAYRCVRRRASLFQCVLTMSIGDVEYRLTGDVRYVTHLGAILEKHVVIKRVFVNYYCLNTGGSGCRKTVRMAYAAKLGNGVTYRPTIRVL